MKYVYVYSLGIKHVIMCILLNVLELLQLGRSRINLNNQYRIS